MKSTAVILALLFVCFMMVFPVLLEAQDCPEAGTIVGSVMTQTIDCGGGHDCRVPVCGGGTGSCCATNGGYVFCTWCDDYYCTIFTVSCT